MIHWFYMVLTGVLAAVAVLGPIGAAIVFFALPAFIPVLQSWVARFLACRWCMVVVVSVVALVGSYWVGHYDAASDCKADKIAAQLATKNRDLENAQKAKDDETQRANKIEADANARQKDDADYIATLEGRPSCALDDRDLDGVRK